MEWTGYQICRVLSEGLSKTRLPTTVYRVDQQAAEENCFSGSYFHAVESGPSNGIVNILCVLLSSLVHAHFYFIFWHKIRLLPFEKNQDVCWWSKTPSVSATNKMSSIPSDSRCACFALCGSLPPVLFCRGLRRGQNKGDCCNFIPIGPEANWPFIKEGASSIKPKTGIENAPPATNQTNGSAFISDKAVITL